MVLWGLTPIIFFDIFKLGKDPKENTHTKTCPATFLPSKKGAQPTAFTHHPRQAPPFYNSVPLFYGLRVFDREMKQGAREKEWGGVVGRKKKSLFINIKNTGVFRERCKNPLV